MSSHTIIAAECEPLYGRQMAAITATAVKPKLRGIPDLVGFIIAIPIAIWVISIAQTDAAVIATSVYAASVLLLLGISTVYHLPNWPHRTRMWLRRMDHSAIFVLIAGSYTPYCMLALERDAGSTLLWIQWGLAIGGALVTLFWHSPPRWVIAGFCLALGYMVVPYASEFWNALSGGIIALILIGGVAYTMGAIAYAQKWPRLAPNVFGYHELFHVLVVAALGFHYAAVYQLLAHPASF